MASRSSGPVDLVGLIAGHSESAFYNDIEVRNSSLKLSMLVSGLDNYFDGIGGAIGGGTNSDINNIILDDVRIENAAGLSTMGAYRNIGGVLGRIDASGWAINDAKLFTTISLSTREDPSIGGGRRAIMGVGGLVGSGNFNSRRICNDVNLTLSSTAGVQHVGGLVGFQAGVLIETSENYIQIDIDESAHGISYVGGAYGQGSGQSAVVKFFNNGRISLRSVDLGGPLPIEHVGGLMGRYTGSGSGFAFFHVGSFVDFTTTADASTTKGGVLGSYTGTPTGQAVYYANDLAAFPPVGDGVPLAYITGNTEAYWLNAPNASYSPWSFGLGDPWMRPAIPSYPLIRECQ